MIDYQNGDGTKIETIETSTNEGVPSGAGMQQIIANSVKFDTPKELESFPNMKEKHITAKRKAYMQKYNKRGVGHRYLSSRQSQVLSALLSSVRSPQYQELTALTRMATQKREHACL